MKKNIQGKPLGSLLMSGSVGIGKVDLVHEIGREFYEITPKTRYFNDDMKGVK